MDEVIKLKVRIDRILFPKGREVVSGEYVIFTAKPLEVIEGTRPVVHEFFKTVTLKGNIPHVRSGDVFTMRINAPATSKYGTSYEVLSVIKEVDLNNKNELMEYFTIMAGKKIAKELMKIENAYEMLNNKDSKELLKIKGIGEARLEQIYKNIGQYSDYSYAYIHLEKFGLTRNLINRICLEVGGAVGAVEICKTNPYCLVKRVKGISFRVADYIGLQCGLALDNEERMKYAILSILQDSGESGKSYLSAIQLLEELKKLAIVDLYKVDLVVKELKEQGAICISEDGCMVALKYFLDLEMNIAKELLRIQNASNSYIEVPDNWMDIVRERELMQEWNHTDEQLKGIETTLKENLVVITGKAGTGKSTITNVMIDILKYYDIEMCCLSAKACERLKQITGVEAKTIHRLLGLGTAEEVTEIFADIVIVDEASMIAGSLFLKLLRAIKTGAKLIILGDDGQLTPIGDCAVFTDILKADSISKVILTKIHRQAEKSAIITKSIALRNQEQIYEKGFRGHRILGELQDLELFIEEENTNILNLVKKKFIQDLGEVQDILEVQVITTMKNRGTINTMALNIELQNMVNPRVGEELHFEGSNGVKIFTGDKVINLKNNYRAKSTNNKTTPVFNGSIGIVKRIDLSNIIVDFQGIGEVIIEDKDYENINLAYAITCHSSQGSQWKRVIATFDMASYMLLNVEMLYTIITRASNHCSLITTDKALKQAIRSVEKKTKQTLLLSFL